MNGILERLPILVLSPHGRCNCRCVMCDIWKSTDSREMTAKELDSHLASIESLGVEWVVLSGGEPLMHSDLFRLCEALKTRGIRITLLSTGLLLDRHATEIVAWIDEVIVSLDGPAEVHDRIRNVAGAFAKLAQGVASLRALRPDYPIKARSTVQRMNHSVLSQTVNAARAIGLDGISFLAADLASEAFNRTGGWPIMRQSQIALSAEQLRELEREIATLSQCERDGFVSESPAKLQRIVDHFESHIQGTSPIAPPCNAPWVSAVVETDGTVRPCFFHPPYGTTSPEKPLLSVLNGPEAIEFRQNLNVASDPVCRRCVCSLNWKPAGRED